MKGDLHRPQRSIAAIRRQALLYTEPQAVDVPDAARRNRGSRCKRPSMGIRAFLLSLKSRSIQVHEDSYVSILNIQRIKPFGDGSTIPFRGDAPHDTTRLYAGRLLDCRQALQRLQEQQAAHMRRSLTRMSHCNHVRVQGNEIKLTLR